MEYVARSAQRLELPLTSNAGSAFAQTGRARIPRAASDRSPVNPSWPLGLKLFYIVACFVMTTAILIAVDIVAVKPLQEWLKPHLAAVPPEIGFPVMIVGIPLLWFVTYRVGRRQGWI